MKPVCRYYLGDGLRFSAQSTWLEMFKEEGDMYVAIYREIITHETCV
jgi:hypothetical protein